MQAAAEFGDLAREVRRAARQVGDLAADVGAVAQAHGGRIVEDEDGQGRQRHDRRVHRLQARQRVEHETKRRGDQHHADADEDRRDTDHGMRNTLPRRQL
jgi:hypothetical protein